MSAESVQPTFDEPEPATQIESGQCLTTKSLDT